MNDHYLNELYSHLVAEREEWQRTLNCIGDMVIRADDTGIIIRCNKAVKTFTGKTYNEIVGRYWDELLFEQESDMEIGKTFGGNIELFHTSRKKWFLLKSHPFIEKDGSYSGFVIIVQDYSSLKQTKQKLEQAYSEVKSSQAAILQQEKMASIGQLAAGVAHEINNPIGFISSNLGTLEKYVHRLTQFISFQSEMIASLGSQEKKNTLESERNTLKLDYIEKDINELIKESKEGADRVKVIVQNLKSFSRVDDAEYKNADINECLESTINIVWNELKYKAVINKEYGELQPIKCYPQQLNQVFMNLLVNAGHAIEKQGVITIRTCQENGFVNIAVSDTGCGIPEEKMNRIFEPFFTTKEVGKGTGLGLSITYDIIKKHQGHIAAESKMGEGTTFTVTLPVDAAPERREEPEQPPD